MSISAAVQQGLAKLRQGPVQLVIDPDDTAVEIFLRGGVDLAFLRAMEEADVDLVGVYDLYTAGDSAEFELNIPERSQNVVNVIFPEGLSGSDANSYTYIGVGVVAGISMRDHALEFRFRPWHIRTLSSEQVQLWKCTPSGDAALSQQVSEPHTWTQTFKALPDASRTEGELIGRITTAIRA